MIGYSFFKEEKTFWRNHQKVIIPLSMPHALGSVTKKKATQVLKENRSLLIRWESKFDKPEPSEWWHIIKDEEESLDKLSSSTRSKVRRGSKKFRSYCCTKAEIIDHGYDVYCLAYERYNTFEKKFSQVEFVNSIKELPDFTEFWITRDIETGLACAFSENIVVDGACFYLSIWFSPESLKRYSSYTLIHEMNKYYLNDKKMNYVSDGARNISHETGIHDFLVSKFKFRKAYCDLNVIYKHWLFVLVKVLYPFRFFFQKRSGKIKIILMQERIRLSCLAIKKLKLENE